MNVWRRLASVSPSRFCRSFLRCCPIVAVSLLAVTWGVIAGQPEAKTKGAQKPTYRYPGEPLAKSLSLTRGEQFLDRETLTWLSAGNARVATPVILTCWLAQAAGTRTHPPHFKSASSSRTASSRGTVTGKGPAISKAEGR